MSRVTNLLIIFSTLENENNIIAEMSNYIINGNNFNILSINDERMPQDWYGGTKRLECNVLIGAYNYLDLGPFLAFLRTEVSWEAADLVQVFVKEQNDMKFRLIDLIPC
ncbi:hypothetical protein ACFOTA_17855 [Chitinophaga sp. GCM10012297]|uniref:Uncharacterized protein n=1 Tax=Chitinophaga chungangae TaxID=2821488 RepID=A0ABS3YHD7_9BACT|nr:hypothetical protein [Chitinophaga chungangae]MBO9154087.1 hypothetical protein [Chitinophaga chungangae]